MPPAKLPIVFVSANLFDNQPERLVALECQGFVGKPVLESELLDTLHRTLNIDWVRDDQDLHGEDSYSERGPGHAQRTFASRADAKTSMRLARQGQAVALRQRLRRARDELPEHLAALKLLITHASTASISIPL